MTRIVRISEHTRRSPSRKRDKVIETCIVLTKELQQAREAKLAEMAEELALLVEVEHSGTVAL